MTREEFEASGNLAKTATCTNRKSANDWARDFSDWYEGTWVTVAGDGYFEVLPLRLYEPWRGRISARFNGGQRVTA